MEEAPLRPRPDGTLCILFRQLLRPAVNPVALQPLPGEHFD
jgi:hypothetical protein